MHTRFVEEIEQYALNFAYNFVNIQLVILLVMKISIS